ncbi:MAG: TonB-dependent receptor [Acidobacteria bacterium]|nr:TonB-dependent receptor [Acidobacteriota bacterium]
MKARLIALFVSAALLSQASLSAQTHRGTIRGTITDQQGAVIRGAAVKLVNVATNDTRAIESGEDGDYALASLPAGTYRLEVGAANFKQSAREIGLQVNQEFRADVTLAVGPLAERIDEDSGADLLRPQTESASLSTVIEERQVTQLPLDGRNYLDLALLVPGAVPNAFGSAGSVRGDFSFSVNGAREDANNFLLDGVYNVDPKLNTFAVRPPVDGIREFEVLSGAYDASFGRNGGAQINVVTKSGTNEFHGTAYEFHRNAALDARNFFAPADQPDPKYIRNQFGFSFGGPLRRDRTFFFGDYEGTRVREGITRVTNVPTLAERQGDFSQSLTGCPRNPFTGQPFAGCVVPREFQHPVGRAIANLYPLPNRAVPFANFVSSPVSRDRNDHFDVRVDHFVSDRSQLNARYSFGDRELFEPFTGPTFSLLPGFGDFVPRRSQNFLLSETHLFSPRLVNEARFAFNRVAQSVTQEGRGRSLNREVGLPELSSNPRDFGLSFITVGGFSPLGDEFNNPQASTTNTFQFNDNASYVRGGHLLKFGFDFRHARQDAFRDVQSRGFLTFTNQLLTGNPLADLLLGFPTITGGARVDNPQRLRTESYNFYANDSWRVTPRLSLTAGLRYELNSPPVDEDDRANVYDLATRSLVQVGTNGVPRGGYETDKNNFAPRVGLAYTLGDDTAVRAGYGVYYDQSALAPGEALYFNQPYFTLSLFFPLGPQQLISLSDPFPQNFPFQLPATALAFQRDLSTPYMQHWNANVQRQLGRNRVLEVGYVGSKGTKLLASRDINQPAQASPVSPNPRPNPFFADINLVESRASSSYHSLQARLQQRLTDGLALLASYTYGKSIDDASSFFTSAGDPNFPQNSYDTRQERARSNFDVRQRLSVSYSYDLPFGRGRRFGDDHGFLSTLLSGWQTNGVVTLQTGRPFTIALLSDIDQSNTGRSNLGFGANDRPDVVGDPRLSHRTPERWFNTAAYAFPAFGTFGNSGRNTLDGPGYRNVNASLVKHTRLTESASLQLRAEAFNLFNHPNFDLPDNFLGSPTFGQIRSAQSPRHLQFGVKLLF